MIMPTEPAPVDKPAMAAEDAARDETIAKLRAELDEIRSTPEGAAGEMRKSLDALAAEVERMKSGKGLVPQPDQTDPDPLDYWARLATGELVELPNPHATHHYSEQLKQDVPVEAVFAKAEVSAGV